MLNIIADVGKAVGGRILAHVNSEMQRPSYTVLTPCLSVQFVNRTTSALEVGGRL